MQALADQGPITPRLLLDEKRMLANIEGMNERLLGQGVTMRPHVKTAKSLPIVERMLAQQPEMKVTVSTLAEAEACFAAGLRDILYAVGMVPSKLMAVQSLNQRGARIAVLIDSVAMALALSAQATMGNSDTRLPVFIELDVDAHRAGVAPESPALMQIAQKLAASEALELAGVMTHAGAAYQCRRTTELVEMAERERRGAVLARDRLLEAGMPCPVVSIGSTPTARFARSFTGITEVRVGVYVFQDLTMLGLGVCGRDDLALSVLTTVIGHQPSRNTLLVDAGWMALSGDRSTSKQMQDQGYGLVVGEPDQSHSEAVGIGGVEDALIVSAANQEHGLVTRRDAQPFELARYPIGSCLRIYPNHACATAAAFSHYDVARVDGSTARWPRFGGWA